MKEKGKKEKRYKQQQMLSHMQIRVNQQALTQKLFDQLGWYLYKLEELERLEVNSPPSVVMPTNYRFPPSENFTHLLNQLRIFKSTFYLQIEATDDECKAIPLQTILKNFENDLFDWLAARLHRPITEVDLFALDLHQIFQRKMVEDYRPMNQNIPPEALLNGFQQVVDGTQKAEAQNQEFERNTELKAQKQFNTVRGPREDGIERLKEINSCVENRVS
eukprot:TRINITY_DN240_c0_g1_i3.p1 TRINITY_DN240_c0_g1~~TRINITY_DN240_c0_g1_i3.p1  ORF type:complete len:219 (+),score=54.54 TRINITY_DN240_c0_g1_i3:81-737(+)